MADNLFYWHAFSGSPFGRGVQWAGALVGGNIAGVYTFSGNVIVANPLHTGAGGTIAQVHMYAPTAASGNGRFAIYDLRSGTVLPGDLLTQSDTVTLAGTFLSVAASCAVRPGIVYLAFNHSVSWTGYTPEGPYAMFGVDPSSAYGTRCGLATSYSFVASGFPATFPGSYTFTGPDLLFTIPAIGASFK